MALPLSEVPAISDSSQLSDEQAFSIIRMVLSEMDAEKADMDEARQYYDGEQSIKYSTSEFERAFGKLFKNFKANWCEVAISATQERLEMDRVVYRDGELGEVDDKATTAIKDIFRVNAIDDIENDLYSSAAIESRAAIMVWPGGDDDDQEVLLTVERGQEYYIIYEDDNPRRPRFVVRRWKTSLGEIFVNLYDNDWVYKYKSPKQFVDLTSVANSFEDSGLERKVTEDEDWPLEMPFSQIPIVEFRSRKEASELDTIIPIQDAINKTIINMLVAGEYSAHSQAYIVSSNKPPEGGWKRRPGTILQIQPEVDLDGKAMPTEVGVLKPEDPTSFVQIAEFLLSQFSSLSRTPGYYVFSSNSESGRGDAPSGDALKVTETTLIKKVEGYQQRWNNPWIIVAALILEGLDIKVPKYAEVTWVNAQKHFMGMLLEEGRKMIDELGLPHRHAWKHVGLSEAEIKDAQEALDKRQEEERKMAQSVTQPVKPKALGASETTITKKTQSQMKTGSTASNT